MTATVVTATSARPRRLGIHPAVRTIDTPLFDEGTKLIYVVSQLALMAVDAHPMTRAGSGVAAGLVRLREEQPSEGGRADEDTEQVGPADPGLRLADVGRGGVAEHGVAE